LALLAFEIGGEKGSAKLLSIALLLRVSIFVLVSPYAGVLADRLPRKSILVVTHLFRMVIVGLFPLVTREWEIYLLVGGLNFFNAFFTPTYKAIIPQIINDKKMYGQAISLSSATYQLLGVLGPGIAGILAVWMGVRQIFLVDSVTFLIAAVLIFFLPGSLKVNTGSSRENSRTLQSIKSGTYLLFHSKPVRYGLLMQLVVSLAGAQVLVNTVGYVRGSLNLAEQQYGWVMAALAIGATAGALLVGYIQQKIGLTRLVAVGAVIVTLAVLPGNWIGLTLLMICWALAGTGQSLVNIPTETLIAREISKDDQGKVYGAHFAWSHLWWVFAYPLAGWLGESFSSFNFLISSLIAAVLFIIIHLQLRIKTKTAV
jgi:NRE family putative nickel resistance protein-like MFS transporter